MRTALIAGLAVLAFAAPAAAQTTTDTTPTIAADGVGTATLTPDIATFAAMVSETAPTSSAARTAANRITAAIRGAATGAGVAATDIRTIGVSIRRERIKKRKRPTKIVFNASQAITIKVRDITKLGPLIDAAAEAGAEGVDGPEFDFADPSAGRLLATRAALADARKRADDAAAQTGLRIVGVRSVVLAPDSDEEIYETASGGSEKAASQDDSAEPTNISPGTRDFTERVRVIYTAAPL